MKKRLLLVVIFLSFVYAVYPQSINSTEVKNTISSIKEEVQKNPQVSDIVSILSDQFGSRVTWSDAFYKSAEWAKKRLTEYGLADSHFEEWEPMGNSWNLKKFSAVQTAPYTLQLIAHPKTWSPSTKGTVKGKPVYLEAKEEKDLEKYKGKLKGAIVFISPIAKIRVGYKPWVSRTSDDDIKKLESYTVPSPEEKKKEAESKEMEEKEFVKNQVFTNRIVEFCMKEGAALLVEHGNRVYGSIQAFGALLPKPIENIDDFICAGYKAGAGKTVPQIIISAEQYNSIIRSIQNGADVKLEVNIEAGQPKLKKGLNIVAEIPGSDLKNEIVIVGAHIDTQGPSIGATDNAAGVAVCMEALRVLKKLGIKPRRTIRIGLWGGEEQWFLGAKDYVNKHFSMGNSDPSKEKCYIYLNTDNGAGRFRGLYLQENEKAKPLVKKWFDLIDMKLTVSLSPADNTDHIPFDEKGLPGFQFMQDILDYMRIYHTNMDRLERIPPEDLKDNSIIMAALAYLASIDEEKFPLKN